MKMILISIGKYMIIFYIKSSNLKMIYLIITVIKTIKAIKIIIY